MKLNKLMEIADKAYQDGQIMAYWDKKNQKPRSMKEAEAFGGGDTAGATFARGIVVELAETFDPDGTDQEQTEQAAQTLGLVTEDIAEVIVAFQAY